MSHYRGDVLYLQNGCRLSNLAQYPSRMPILNFKEIPPANVAARDQDAFELFASEVLALIGYKVIERPSRGPDGGKDLIVGESRKGVGGETKIRWAGELQA